MPDASPHSPEPTAPPRTAAPRSRLHLIYYVLAGFDLVTVSLSLALIAKITASYSDSVERNREWAARLGQYWMLSVFAASVTRPANDVFLSGDVEGERQRFDSARLALEAQLRVVERDLEAIARDEPRSALERAFATVRKEKLEVEARALDLFTAFAGQNRTIAGENMALMDRAFYAMNDALATLSSEVRRIQQDHLRTQREAAESVRRFEYVIAGLIVMMVIGVAAYGHVLARQMKRAAQELARYRDHLEALVEERTAALQTSHEKLRTAERLASMGTLAAGLGHDMNNVLFPLRCRLDAVESQSLDDQMRALVGGFRHSVRYLQQLSDGLRLLAMDPDRPHEGDGQTTLHSWWREAAPLFRAALPRQARLDVDLAPDLPPVAVAPHALTQAVFNLVVNSGEAIDEDGTVAIRAEAADAGRAVRLTVTDDGVGMSEDVRRRALDPFFTTKRRGLSTGLGLALVHGVATSAGGTVHIESEPGGGTSVSLTLPAATRPAVVADTARRATVSLGNPRVASFITGLLSAARFEVVTGPDGGPGDVALWITDPSPGALEMARGFLAGGGARRVIVYGSDDRPAWQAIGAESIDPAGGLSDMRRAIEQAAGAVR
jgi:signal transduction histidine kinase